MEYADQDQISPGSHLDDSGQESYTPNYAELFADELGADGKLQVSVYAVDRCYGGPEEGGWYYDTYHFAGVSERILPADIEAARERLLALFADQQPRYPISSVCSDGPEYHACIEGKAGSLETHGRPYYS